MEDIRKVLQIIQNEDKHRMIEIIKVVMKKGGVKEREVMIK